MKKMYDVVIVGAGMAGLSAAYEAKQKNLSVIVFDARDRIGGRVYSHKLKNGLVIERGAEWIGKTHKELLAFCRKFSIRLEPHRYQHERYFTKDGIEFSGFEELLNRFNELLSSLKEKNIPKNQDWYTFLSKYFSEDEMVIISDVFDSEFGTHIRYVGARTAYRDIALGGDNVHADYHVIGGNSKIVDTLARQINKRNIHTKEPVVAIDDLGDTVQVTTNKRTVVTKKVLVCTATKSLKHIRFEPPIKEKKEVAKHVSYCDITKAFVSYRGTVAKKGKDFSMITNGEIPYVYLASQGQSEKHFALCVYAVGAKAKKIYKMKPETLDKKLRRVLPKDVFDAEKMKLSEVIVQNWGIDKYTGGAYSIYNPGEEDVVRKHFSTPHKNIYFSGSYLGEMNEFMNGAFQSGRDTMRILIKDLQTTKKH